MVYWLYGALAQLGARHTGSVEATGSSPVCSIFLSPGFPGLFYLQGQLPYCGSKIRLSTSSAPISQISSSSESTWALQRIRLEFVKYECALVQSGNF